MNIVIIPNYRIQLVLGVSIMLFRGRYKIYETYGIYVRFDELAITSNKSFI